MEEKLENKEGPEEKCTQPDGHRGCEHREQDAHLTTEQLQLTLCSLEATSNLNTADPRFGGHWKMLSELF